MQNRKIKNIISLFAIAFILSGCSASKGNEIEVKSVIKEEIQQTEQAKQAEVEMQAQVKKIQKEVLNK